MIQGSRPKETGTTEYGTTGPRLGEPDAVPCKGKAAVLLKRSTVVVDRRIQDELTVVLLSP